MRNRYSAEVILQLAVGEKVLPLAQVGPDFAILREPASIAAGAEARIDVIVDNRITSSKMVLLPHGSRDGSRRISYF